MTSLYDKYYDILKHVYNIMNLTDNEELKEFSKKTIVSTINQLVEKDNINKKAYEGILEEFGLIEKHIETSTIEKEDNINKTEIQKDLLVNKDAEQYNTVDEYVFYKIYRNENKLLGDEFQIIMRNLINSIKNNDLENVNLYKNKYDKFVNDNNKILNIDKMNEYFQKTYNEYKIKQDQTLKIKSVNRSYNSNLKNKILSLLALVDTDSLNPLMSTGIGVGGYYLYNKGIKNAKSLIESNGLKLDDNNNLIDSNGKLINEKEINRLKYNLVKRELSKIKNNGRIDSNYKKNKLTSMLLSVPSNMFKSIKDRYEKVKISNENISEEVKDINKGLGIIK